jgi:outer membrane biosynthesis protein TonB
MPVKTGEVSRVTVAAADALGAAMITGVSAVSDRAGLGRLVSADEASPPPAQAIALPSARRTNTKLVRRGTAAEPPVPTSGSDDLFGTVVAYEAPPHLATAIATTAQETSTSANGVDTATALEVYTPASEGVTPPVYVRQQLPRTLSPTVDLANLSRIEMVIAPDGSVESARLLDSRPDVLGGMFLSAVKAWEFHPAIKDGVAVRYRKMILVSFE